LGQTPCLGEIRPPARDRLVNRTATLQQECVAGEIIQPLAVQFVSRADADLLRLAEYVEQHHRELTYPSQGGRVARCHRIEPAAPPRPARPRPVFPSRFANALADPVRTVVELRRERAAADARRIRLDDTDDPLQVWRRDARAAPDSGR